ncbi:MAG: phosphoglycolate phosphatase [Betaproteobacteria bacterium RIFCSPLOWO2_02_FULL_67_26]|nr:MAG: phosphoglycolate phosphatase [Betaproteobacteria bacterium RIFCSPLOWO2_02_FULL_67_26]
MSRTFPLSVKAVTIDLDGTLADTIPDLAAAANMMLSELGRPGLDVERIRTFVGKGIPRLVERALAGGLDGAVPREVFERALPIYERCYAEVNGRHTVVYPGVREGLQRLRAMQLPLACVTNKSGRFTGPLLAHLGIASSFELVIAGDTLPRKKPDPAQLLHACRGFGIEPRAMLMIGDSVNDAEAARAAGCPVFCVSYGYNEGRDVRELDVDAIVASLEEAARLIQKA